MEQSVSLPDLGVDSPCFRWDEYDQLEAAVAAFAERESREDMSVYDALAAILGRSELVAWIEEYDLHGPADRACAKRLITGEETCTCDRTPEETALEMVGDREAPSHQAPHAENAFLWLDADGEPKFYTMHVRPAEMNPYRAPEDVDETQPLRNPWIDICQWVRRWGLEVHVDPRSWYHLFSTVKIIIATPEKSVLEEDSNDYAAK